MKKVEDLKPGDFIAFGFNYHGGKPDQVMVSNISSVWDGPRFMSHFLYGHHSLSEIFGIDNIIAIGNPEGETKIPGWSGKFDLINPELLKQIEDANKE